MDRTDSGFEFIGSDKRVPLYFVAIASDSAAAVLPTASVLLDQSDGLIKEKDQELRDTKASAAEAIQWREQQIGEREEMIASLEKALQWREEKNQALEGAIRQLNEALDWSRNQVSEFEKAIASNEQAL